MYKPQTFLGLEDAMLKPVSSAGSVVARGIEKKIRRAFDNHGADVADQVMLEADFAALGKVVQNQLPFYMRAALIFGAAQVTGSFKDTSITSNKAVDDVIATMTDLHTKIVTDAAKKFIYAQVSNILADADMNDIGEELTKTERIRKTDLADQLNQAVNGGVQLMAGISANLTTSRLVTYGFLFEAKLKGIAQYQLEAVLDDRTSEVCKRLHGRVFQVEQAFSYTDQVLRTTEPDALKAIAPFLRSNKSALAELENMTDEELQARGVMVPPFHPGCRTMLVMLGHSHEEDVSYTPVDFNDVPEAITPTAPADPVFGVDEAVAYVNSLTTYNRALTLETENGGTIKNLIPIASNVDEDAIKTKVTELAAAGFNFDGNLTVEPVQISQLKSFQDGVSKKKVLEFLKTGLKDVPDYDKPLVVRYQGELYVWDGNHRLTAAKAAGLPSLVVQVVTIT